MKRFALLLALGLFILPMTTLQAYPGEKFIVTLKNSRKVQVGLGVGSALLVLGLYFYKKPNKKSQPRNPWKPVPKADVHNLNNDKGVNSNSGSSDDGGASESAQPKASASARWNAPLVPAAGQQADLEGREDFDVPASNASADDSDEAQMEYDAPRQPQYDSADHDALAYHESHGDY